MSTGAIGALTAYIDGLKRDRWMSQGSGENLLHALSGSHTTKYAEGGPVDRDEELLRRRGEHTRSYSQDKSIGSGDNAKSIVRGIKQWLPDIPGTAGDLLDAAYAGAANVLQGQKRRSIAPLGAGPAIRRAVTKKSPLEQVEMRATPETDWFEEGVRLANPAMFMSPRNIAGLGALALASGAPGTTLGVIRRGGRHDLNMVHNVPMTPEWLARFIEERGSLSSPSVAIAKNTVYPFKRSSTFVFNPASPLFDPAQHRGNQLFNRDAYTFRKKDPRTILPNIRRNFGDMRLTEGYYPDDAQTWAIRSSPRFKSFAEYEGSKSGAKTLGKFTDVDADESGILNNKLIAWMQKTHRTDPNVRSPLVMQSLRASAVNGDEEARAILEGLRQLPSDYAELKVLGEVPINPRNVSALMLRDFDLMRNPESTRNLRKAAEDRGVRVGTPKELLPAEHKGLYDDTVGAIGRYLERRKGDLESAPNFTETPAIIQRYMDNDLYKRILNGWDDIDRHVPEYVYKSPQFGAEVAGFLTTKDANKLRGR